MYIRNLNENRIKGDMSHTQKILDQGKSPANKEVDKENPYNDIVSISSEAQELFAEKENLKPIVEINPITDRNQSLIEFIEQLRKQSEEKNDSSNDLLKCIQIAMRIMDGHRVPAKDERFLAENQPEMYLRAVMLRQENKNSKDYKSVLEDKEENPIDQISSSITSQGVSESSISIETVEVSSED